MGGGGGGVYLVDNVIYCHTEYWPRDTTQHDKHQIIWVCVKNVNAHFHWHEKLHESPPFVKKKIGKRYY